MIDYEYDTYGATGAADTIACERVMRVLQTHFPDHIWAVGADHFAGVVTFRLLYDGSELSSNGPGYLLYLSTVLGPDGDRRIRNGGGECLERFQLARGRATEESRARAKQNGLILDNIVTKSKH